MRITSRLVTANPPSAYPGFDLKWFAGMNPDFAIGQSEADARRDVSRWIPILPVR